MRCSCAQHKICSCWHNPPPPPWCRRTLRLSRDGPHVYPFTRASRVYVLFCAFRVCGVYMTCSMYMHLVPRAPRIQHDCCPLFSLVWILLLSATPLPGYLLSVYSAAWIPAFRILCCLDTCFPDTRFCWTHLVSLFSPWLAS